MRLLRICRKQRKTRHRRRIHTETGELLRISSPAAIFCMEVSMTETQITRWADVPITNNFMFSKVLSDKQLTLLPERLRHGHIRFRPVLFRPQGKLRDFSLCE